MKKAILALTLLFLISNFQIYAQEVKPNSTLSIKINNGKRYLSENEVDFETELNVAIGQNTANITLNDQKISILTPSEAIGKNKDHSFIKNGYARIYGVLSSCNGSKTDCGEDMAYYQVKIEKQAKLLGVFNLKPVYSLKVGAQSGKVYAQNKPLFYFLYW